MNTARKIIVIGTGAGGLSAAGHLARRGHDVLALEQAEQPGGFLAPFEREGYRFGPGLQYLGMCRPGQFVHQVLTELGIDVAALFCELDPDGFDVFRFPDLEVRMNRDLAAYERRLAALFPHDVAGLARFFAMARDVEAVEDVMNRLADHEAGLGDLRVFGRLPTMLRWARHSLAELLDHTLSDPRARAVLAAQAGDYGLPPAQASAIVALMVLLHYGDGAFFPRGGSGGLRDALVAAVERQGARIRTRARVRRILVEDRRVLGVELASGERIAADAVVCDADPAVTFGELIAPEELPSRLVRKAQRSEPSLAPFSLFLGLRRDVRDSGLGRFNLWLYPDWDLDALYASAGDAEGPARPWLFVSSGSAKDDSGVLAPPGCSTLEVTTFMPFAPFRRFAHLPAGGRGPEYGALKQAIADRMLAELERQIPGLVRDVAVREASTPLTNVDYVGAPEGGAYGPAATPGQWGLFRYGTDTPVRGLWLAGAGVHFHGVAAALLSGKEAASAVARHRW